MYKLKQILCVILLIIAIMFTYTNISKATTVEVTTETLNLRKEPSTSSDIVALISIGEECEVLDEEEDWYHVQYGEYTGYISKEYAEVVGGDSESSNENNSTGGNTNTTTETNSDNENNVQENNVIDNTQTSTETNESTQTSTSAIQNITATTNAQTRIRITPLINSNVIETIKNNTKVTVINQINGWSFIQTDEIAGWVRTDSLDISENTDNAQNTSDGNDSNENDNNASSFTEKTMFATDYVNIRKEPNANADKIMVVEQNTELKVVGESGDWYEVETSEGNAYVLKELLSDKKITVTNRGNIDRTKDEKNELEEEVENTSTSNSSKGESNSSSTDSVAKEIVSYAKKFLGVPYVYGGASPSGFDCSGFTMYVYDHFGISMRHGAQAQAKLGKKVTADKSSKSSLLNNLEVGDLVFFLDYETMDEIGHCGIYIGNGNFIHASSGSGYCVKINSLLPGEYYNTRYCAARRVI